MASVKEYVQSVINAIGAVNPNAGVGKGAINPTGTYDKVWFNTNLSYEEFANIAKNLTFVDSGYYIFINSDPLVPFFIIKSGDVYALATLSEGMETPILTPQGWDVNLVNPLVFNESLTGVDNWQGVSVGQQNELLKDLIYVETTSNVINAQDVPNKIRELMVQVGTGGNEINSTDKYDTFYFNTSLSVAEVDSILSKLPYVNGAYSVYKYDNYRSDGGKILFDVITIVNKDYVSQLGVTGEGYMILCSRDLDTLSFVYNSFANVIGGGTNATIGWQGIESYSFNPTYVENPVYVAGTSNNLLTKLVSPTTTFGENKQLLGSYDGSAVEVTEARKVDIGAMLDEGKLPLEVNVNIEAPVIEGTIDITENGTYDVTQYASANVNVASSGEDQTLIDLIERDITEITIPNGTTKIGDYAFSQTSSLTSVTIPNSVISIGTEAFSFSSISSVEVPNSVTTFRSQVFRYCSNLKDVILGNNITSFGGNVFGNCIALTNFSMTDIKVNLQIGSGTSWGTKLTLDSLINTCKELINVGSAKTLTMGTANLNKIASTYVKFTDSTQTTIPTNEKGDVVVCESTDEGAMLLSDYALLKNWTLA